MAMQNTIQDITIYCFSGTGNTLLATKRLVKELEQRGYTTRLLPMENSNPADVPLNGMIGLAFPIAMQVTYPVVTGFIKKMPDSSGTPVFMIDTLHSFSGAVISPLRQLMKRKGYRPVAAEEFLMPMNMVSSRHNTTATDTVNARITNTMHGIAGFADKIATSTGTWGYIPLFPTLLGIISGSNPLTWWLVALFGAMIYADIKRCTSCGICSKLCPTQNIRRSSPPKWGIHCQMCMRCFAYCPEHAIKTPLWKPGQYRGVPVSEMLKFIQLKKI
jgi:Pyruvate/2-oxoacid:ferredoxin oxidoreductase delta subunit/flavodoxin